jgi:hypothetical protein
VPRLIPAPSLATALQDAVFGELVVVLKNRADLAAISQVGFQEIALALVDRLVIVHPYTVDRADLAEGQEFPPKMVQPGFLVGETQGVAGVALEVAVETDAVAEVIGAPALLERRHAQNVALAQRVEQRVIDVLVVAVAIGLASDRR